MVVNQVNQSPTLTAIADPAAIKENAGLQTINLSGISQGTGETQALQITATSDNTALIPNPTVTYTSPIPPARSPTSPWPTSSAPPM